MRRRIEHAWIKVLHEVADVLRKILYVRYLGELQLHEKILLDELIYHIVRRADHVIVSGVVFNDGIHFLVGVEVVRYHRIARLFIEGIHKFRIDIVSEVVHIDHALLSYLSRSGRSETHGNCHGYYDGKDDCQSLLGGHAALIDVFFTLGCGFFGILFFVSLEEIGCHEHQKHYHEDHSGKRK